MVTVNDDESLPEISIDADSVEVIENVGTAEFKLSTTGLTADTTLMINATPAENGHDFLTDAVAGIATTLPVEFTDPDDDDTYTGEFSVSLNNDTTGEPTGSIKLTLNPDPNLIKSYQLGSNTEGIITILDDDAPELKITAGNPVTENNNVACDLYRIS